jgi:hypothetical protein
LEQDSKYTENDKSRFSFKTEKKQVTTKMSSKNQLSTALTIGAILDEAPDKAVEKEDKKKTVRSYVSQSLYLNPISLN